MKPKKFILLAAKVGFSMSRTSQGDKCCKRQICKSDHTEIRPQKID